MNDSFRRSMITNLSAKSVKVLYILPKRKRNTLCKEKWNKSLIKYKCLLNVFVMSQMYIERRPKGIVILNWYYVYSFDPLIMTVLQ